MFKYVGIYLKIQTAQAYNTFIFRLKQLPGLKNIIPQSAYGMNQLKTFLHIFSGCLILCRNFLYKGIYFAFLALLANALTGKTSVLANQQEIFLVLLLISSLGLGTITKGPFLSTTAKDDLIQVKIFRIPAKAYFASQRLFSGLLFLVSYPLMLQLTFSILHIEGISAWFFSFLTLGTRVLFGSVLLPLYDPQGEKATKRVDRLCGILGFVTIGLGIALFLVSSPLNMMIFFNSPAGWCGLLFLGLGIMVYRHSTRIETLAQRILRFDLLKQSADLAAGANTAGVRLKSKDYALNIQRTGANHLKGIAYLNGVFFARLGRYLWKQVLIRCLVLIGIFTLFCGVLIFRKVQPEAGPAAKVFLPGLILVSYFIYTGETFSKFCFFNLDRNLLKYNFYREKHLVLLSIRTRLKHVLIYNLPILAVMILGTCAVFAALGILYRPRILLYLLLEILLMLFFSLHELYMYFLFQPYTDSLEAKSGPYNFIHVAVYILCTQTYQIGKHAELFFYLILIVLAIYLPLGLYLVQKFAPKTFRLR